MEHPAAAEIGNAPGIAFCSAHNTKPKQLKKGLLFAAILTGLVGQRAFAQQEPQFTHYNFDRLQFNPASAGSKEGYICGNAIYHKQWGNFTDPFGNKAPATFTFGASGSFGIKPGRIGVGLHIINDSYDPINNLGFNLIGNFRRQFSFGEVAVGIGVGGISHSIKNEWRGPTQGVPDPALPPVNASGFLPDASIGLWASGEKWFGGLSYDHLIPSKFPWGSTSNSKLQPIVYATGGYNYALTDRIQLQPSGLVRYDFTKFQFDVTGLAMLDERFWGGASLHLPENLSALALMFGAYVTPSLSLGYSLDVATAQAQAFGFKHELMIGYCYPLPIPASNFTKSTRFL